MVGVPGRSKGCNTCRKRRVKCDETKPVCARCTKGGFNCTGYQRDRIWQNTSTAPLPGTATNHAGLQIRLLAKNQSRPPIMVIGDAQHVQTLWHATDKPSAVTAAGDKNASTSTSTYRSRDEVQSPPPEMSLVAFKGDFCFAFMFSNFVWRVYSEPWLGLAASGKLGSLSLNAAQALAETNFGRSNSKMDIQLHGLTLYGQCLKSMAASLTSSEEQARHERRELLVPIMLLLMQSASNSDRAGSASHLRGTVQLLQVCGPEAFQDQPYLNALEATRATLVVAGLVSKQRLFLAQEKWLTVPWATNKAYKTPQSELLDILMAVPGLLEEHAAMEDDPQPVSREAALKILRQVQAQLVALYTWRWRWQRSSGHSVSVDIIRDDESDSSPEGNECLGSASTSRRRRRLRFGRFNAAAEIMLYNAVTMWYMALLWKIDPLGAGQTIETCARQACSNVNGNGDSSHESFAPLRRPGGALSVVDPAMEICQVFEWVSRHHSRSREPTFLYMLPMGMAVAVLGEKARQDGDASWAIGLLDLSPITANYAKLSNPAGFGFYLTPESLNPGEVQVQQRTFPEQDIASFNELHNMF